MNYDVGVIVSRLLLSPEPFSATGTAPAVGAWFDLYSRTLSGGDSGGYTGFTIRQTVAVIAYAGAAPSTGTKLRVTVQGGAAAGVAWDKVYIGHAAAAGDAYDFDGTQVQVLFSGSASGSVASGSASLVSDAMTYAFDKTKALVISMHIAGPADTFSVLNSATNFSNGFKSGDSAATTDDTGFTVSGSQIVGFPKVEVFG